MLQRALGFVSVHVWSKIVLCRDLARGRLLSMDVYCLSGGDEGHKTDSQLSNDTEQTAGSPALEIFKITKGLNYFMKVSTGVCA